MKSRALVTLFAIAAILTLFFTVYVTSEYADAEAAGQEYYLDDGEMKTVGGYTYTAGSGGATVVIDSDVLTITNGRLEVPEGASVTFGSYTYTAGSGGATIAVDSDAIALATGDLLFPQYAQLVIEGFTYTAAADSEMSYSDANGYTVLVSGSVQMTNDSAAVLVDVYQITGASGISLSGNVVTMTVPAFDTEAETDYIVLENTDGVESYSLSNASSTSAASLSYDMNGGSFTILSGAFVYSLPEASFTVNGCTVSPGTAGSTDITLGPDYITVPRESVLGFTYGGNRYSFTTQSETATFSLGESFEVAEGTVLIADGDAFVVGSYTYTVSGETVVAVADSTATLSSGTVVVPRGAPLKLGDVTVTNSSTTSVAESPAITVTSAGAVTLAAGDTVTTSVNSTSYTFTAGAAATVTVGSDATIAVPDGTYDLSAGNSIAANGVLYTAVDASQVVVAGAEPVKIVSGSITLTANTSETTSVKCNDINGSTIAATGASAVAVSGTAVSFTAPADGTLVFSGSKTGTYANASSTDVLVMVYGSGGANSIELSSGSYKLAVGSSAYFGTYRVSLQSASGTVDYAEVSASSVKAYSGQVLSFLINNDPYVYSVVDDGTVMSVSSSGVAMSEGAVTLGGDDYAGSILLGSYSYGAAAQSVIAYGSSTATLRSGAVIMPSGASVVIGSATYLANGDGSTTLYYDASSPELTGGSIALIAGASVTVTSITISNTGPNTYTVPVGREITLVAGDSISTAYNQSADSFEAQTATDIYIEDDGTVSVTSGTVNLDAGESLSVNGTVYTAVTASQFTVAESAATLVSGTVTLTGECIVKINSMEIAGATTASVEDSGTYVTTIGEDSYLSVGDFSYTNTSSTAALTLTCTEVSTGVYAFAITSGECTVLLSETESVRVGDYSVSAADGDSLDLTLTPDSVTVTAPGAILFSADDGSYRFTVVSDTAAFSVGDVIGVTSGTLTVASAYTFYVDGGLYTVASDATLTVDSGTVTLSSGSLSVPAGGNAVVLVSDTFSGVKIANDSASGDATVTSDGYVTLDAEEKITTYVGSVKMVTFTSPGALTALVDQEGAVSVYAATSLSLSAGSSLVIGEFTFTAPSDSGAVLSVAEGVPTLTSGSIIIPVSGSVGWGETTVTNDMTSANAMTLTFAGEIIMKAGDNVSTSSEEYTAPADATLHVSSSGGLSIYDIAEYTLYQDGSITVGDIAYTALEETVVYVSEGVLCLSSGSVTVPKTGTVTVFPQTGSDGVEVTNGSTQNAVRATYDGYVTMAYGDVVYTDATPSFEAPAALTALVGTDGTVSVYTMDSAQFAGGASIIVGGLTYSVPTGSTAALSVTNGALGLDSGSIYVPKDGTVTVGNVVVSNGGTNAFTVPSDLMNISLADGDVITTDGEVDDSFTSVGVSTVNVEGDGTISMVSGAVSLAVNDTLTVSGTVFTAVTASQLTVAASAATLLSGTVSLTGECVVTISGIEIVGATSASVETSGTVVSTSGQDSYLSINDVDYGNGSATATLKFTYVNGRFCATSGTVVLTEGSAVYSGYYTISSSSKTEMTITFDGSTVTFNSGDVPMFSYEREGYDSFSYGFELGSDTVFSLGDTVGVTSGTVTVANGTVFTANSFTYTSDSQSATVTVGSSAVTIDSGSLSVPAGASVATNGTTVTNKCDTASVSVDSDGYIDLASGDQISTSTSTYTASAAVTVYADGDGSITLYEAGSATYPAGTVITAGNTRITAVAESTITVSEGAAALTEGEVTLTAVDSTGTTVIVVGGVAVTGASGASVTASQILIRTAEGGTLEYTVSTAGYTYANAYSDDLVLSADPTSETLSFSLYSGYYKLFFSTASVPTATVNGVHVNFTNGTTGSYIGIGLESVLAFSGQTLTIGNNSFDTGADSTILGISSLGGVTLTAGTVTAPASCGTLSVGGFSLTIEEDATVSYDGSSVELLSGGAGVPYDAALIVAGTDYTFTSDGVIYSANGVAYLDSGSVKVLGGFTLELSLITVTVTGADAVSVVGGGDSPSMSLETAQELTVTLGTASYTFITSTASFGFGVYNDDVTEYPKVIVQSGYAVLTSGSAVWAPLPDSGKDVAEYIMFDQPSEDGKVMVEPTEYGPRVTVGAGSINLTTLTDPTYANAGTGDLVFLANNEDAIVLESGTVSIPEGASVTVDGITITNTSGTVTVTDGGVVTVSAGSSASISAETESYVIDNTSGTTDKTENVVERESASERVRYVNEKAHLLIELDMYQADAYSSALLSLVLKTYAAIEDRVYDSSMSYDENVSAVNIIYEEFTQEWEVLYASGESDFAAYKTVVLAKIGQLHTGETSLTEKRLINSAYSEASSVEYDSNLSLKDNQAVLDGILASVNSSLAPYRGDPDSAFSIYKEVMTEYIEGRDDEGLAVISATKTQYVTIMGQLQYLYSKSSEENLARVDDLVSSFDSAVYQLLLTSFKHHKSEITTELAGLAGTYCEPEAQAYISSLLTQLENYAYDKTVLYSDNINRLDDLFANLKSNISAALSGNLSTFDNFCNKYYDLYTNVIGNYSTSGYKGLDDETRTRILEAITAARDRVDTTSAIRLAYDHSKTLAENIEAIHAIATVLSERISQISSEELNNALEKTYAAAITHFSKNDKDGVPTKLRDTIGDYHDQVIAAYEDTTKDVSTKGAEINALMTEYDSVMGPLIEQAEYYLNVDEGEKFLRNEYGSAESTVTDRMEVLISQLRTLTYDTSKTMDENLASLKEAIDGYSQELAVLKYNTVKGNFENYRDNAAWTVSQFQNDDSSTEVKDLVAQFTGAISSLEYNGRSLYANKLAVDDLYGEFEGKYQKLRFDEIRAAYVSEFEADMANIALEEARARAAEYLAILKDYIYDEEKDNGAFLSDFYGDCTVCFAYLKTESLEASTDVTSASNAYFVERRDTIAATTPSSGAAAALKTSTVAGMNSIIADSSYTQPAKAEAIYRLDAAFQAMMDLDSRLAQVLELITTESLMDQSDAVSSLINKYADLVSGYEYDPELSIEENIAAVDAVYEEFAGRLEAQRLLENTVVVGGIQPSGKAVDGSEADYPEGTDEIWGSVSNLLGLGDSASISITTATPASMEGGNIIPAAGSSVDFLADGRVIGAFEIKIYNGGVEVTDFSGEYLVRILLPESMRGQYTTVQVAYVDEYGDVQVHDAKVVGNYLEFYTTHFSLFSLIGVENVPEHYDLYAYLVVAIIVILVLAYIFRVVRYEANGGTGSTPAQFFLGDGEGPVSANGFAREGYRFAGWSRTPEGPADIGAEAQLAELGRFHSIKLFAIWEKEAD